MHFSGIKPTSSELLAQWFSSCSTYWATEWLAECYVNIMNLKYKPSHLRCSWANVNERSTRKAAKNSRTGPFLNVLGILARCLNKMCAIIGAIPNIPIEYVRFITLHYINDITRYIYIYIYLPDSVKRKLPDVLQCQSQMH